jgi:hypothetical protein
MIAAVCHLTGCSTLDNRDGLVVVVDMARQRRAWLKSPIAAANANGSIPSGEEVTKFGARSQFITTGLAESNDVFGIICAWIGGRPIFLCELPTYQVPAGSRGRKCREHDQRRRIRGVDGLVRYTGRDVNTIGSITDMICCRPSRLLSFATLLLLVTRNC